MRFVTRNSPNSRKSSLKAIRPSWSTQLSSSGDRSSWLSRQIRSVNTTISLLLLQQAEPFSLYPSTLTYLLKGLSRASYQQQQSVMDWPPGSIVYASSTSSFVSVFWQMCGVTCFQFPGTTFPIVIEFPIQLIECRVILGSINHKISYSSIKNSQIQPNHQPISCSLLFHIVDSPTVIQANIKTMNLQYPLDDSHIAFKKVQIIREKNGKILLVACNSNETDYSIIIVKRAKSSEVDWNLNELLTEIHGSLKQQEADLEIERNTITTEGLIGFVRFLQGYYLLYIQERERIAKIGRHKINLIKKIGIMPLFETRSDDTRSNQQQYYSLLESYKLENCYYSYTYDVTNSLARNMTRNAVQLFQSERQHNNSYQFEHNIFSLDKPMHGFSEVFQWNHHLLREFAQMVSRKKWLIPVVHGYCKQINIKARGTRFNVIIISRRSRHHAGTRYIKRGINQYGFVANFVQTEQIVVNQTSSQDSKPICSSFIQVRGSAPVYWMQQPSLLVAKPAIQMINSDPLFLATRKHYSDLIGRYGRKIYCVNLMKQVENTPRQVILSEQYSNAVEFINKNDLSPEDAIHYIHIDFKANLKLDKQALVDKIHILAYFCIMKTGLFVCINSSRTDYSQYVEIQNGVIRGNCVDCLDRTNSFQQLVGELALEIQMAKLLRENVTYKGCKTNQKPFKEYGALYEEMGDLISIQYGSSLAHKQKVNKTQAKRLEILTSLTRHWNNNLKDYDRQQEIDVFLGQYSSQGPLIWKTKPPITFFPHKDLRKYESWNWLGQAYDFFMKESLVEMFKRLSDQQKLNMRKINNLQTQQFGRQELLMKFDIDVVDHLLSPKEKVDLLQFCVTPKLRFEKRVWRVMNPKSSQIKPIEQKLKKEYLSYNFANLDQKSKDPADEENCKQKQDNASQLNFIKAPVVTINRQTELDKFISNQVRNYLQPRDELDEAELVVIENYVRNSTVTEQIIQQDIQNQKTILLDQNQIPVQYALPNSEWKQLQQKIKNGDYLQLLPDHDVVHPNPRRKQKKKMVVTKSPIKQKVQRLEQHKTMILEEIIKKHFSHGQRVGKISLV